MINIMQYRLIGSTPICQGERKSMRESRLTSDFSAADAVAAVKARGGDRDRGHRDRCHLAGLRAGRVSRQTIFNQLWLQARAC